MLFLGGSRCRFLWGAMAVTFLARDDSLFIEFEVTAESS